MNEELKIVIKAITEPAQKALKEVQGELEDIGITASKSSKQVNAALSAFGKGSLIAVGAITAVTTALVALGKQSMEFRKIQAQLVAGFNAVGLSAEQAGTTYKELFGFLGEADTAAEAANLLAQLTQDEKELTEWTQILQGVYAKFPDSLPIESLAEAINHTAQLGEVQGTLADALEWSGITVEQFNARLATTSSVAEREAMIRSTLNGLYINASKIYSRSNRALIEYNQSQAQLDQSLSLATQYVVPLMTSLNQLAALLLNVLRPAFENISAVLIAFVQWVMAGIKAVAAFFGAFGKKGEESSDAIYGKMDAITTSTGSVASGVNQIGEAFEDATKEAEKLKRQTMGFDELNVVSSQQSNKADTSSNTPAAAPIEIPNIEIPSIEVSDIELPGLEDFEDKVAKIKEYLDPIAVSVGLIAAGLAAWKITDFITDVIKLKNMANPDNFDDVLKMFHGNEKKAYAAIDGAIDKLDALKAKLKLYFGELLVGVGVLTSIYAISDSWVNGLDWGNFAILLAGVATAVGGMALAFGKLPAAITGAIGGIAMIVTGVKDFIDQGPTVQNTVLIIGGAIATAVAAATMGLAPLIAAIVGVVAAIAGFTAAIILEKEAIMSVDEAYEAHQAAIEAAIEAENSYISAVDAAEASMKRLAEAEAAAGMTGEELYNQVKDGTLTYAEMTDEQKELYKAYIDNEKKQKDLKKATEDFEKAKKAEIKAAYESQLAIAKESDSYDEFKKSIVEAFEKGELSAEEARDLIEKAMSEMSEDAQQTFMKDLPTAIQDGMNPDRYETTRKKLGDWFKKAGDFFVDKIWTPIKNFWNEKVKPIFTVEWWSKTFEPIKTGISNKLGEAKTAISNKWAEIKNWFNTTIKPIFTASYWLNKFNTIKEGAISALNGLLSNVKRIVGEIKSWLSGIGDKVSGAVSSVGNWFSSTFSFGVPRMATGGIVTSSTIANIGEAGREAVLPLENNTGWMDDLADRIASRNSAPTKIVLKVGERELGWATINGINNITKQTGGLQLALV